MNGSRSKVLGLFAKFPDPGRVKTRLAADTSPEWAAAVAEACLRDAVNRLAEIDVERVLVYAPADSRRFFDSLAATRFAAVPQADGDLGERMRAFFLGQLARGAERTVLIGADSPTVPTALIQDAFRQLGKHDLVLGPATDGGYYLIGCSRRLPPVFENVPWGSSRVLAETVAMLPSSAGRVSLLPPWYDVDTVNDWQMLVGHIAAMRRAGMDPGVPHVEALIAHSANPWSSA